jgi:Cytochrome c oxidase subunit IV
MLFTGRLPKRPEVDKAAEIAQGIGEIGFFSPRSWWPLFLALAAVIAALGLAIGWWLLLIGMLFTRLRRDQLCLRVLPRPLARPRLVVGETTR